MTSPCSLVQQVWTLTQRFIHAALSSVVHYWREEPSPTLKTAIKHDLMAFSGSAKERVIIRVRS